MTLAKTCEILVWAIRQFGSGAGCGISSRPSMEEQKKIDAAIRRAEEYIEKKVWNRPLRRVNE